MKVRTLAIVGGGSSAWLTAAYLSNNNPNIKICIIDKEFGNPIGVGEATLLSFKFFMEECGFDIHDWFIPLSAGYKSGILFKNWKEVTEDIWHPFYNGPRMINNIDTTWNIWSRCQKLDFKKYALAHYDGAVIHNSVDFNQIEQYAFHIDCLELVKFLQNKLKNNVEIIKSDVVKTHYKSSDIIDFLELKNGRQIFSDLYIDCTGLHNVLKTPKERVDTSDRLFVNAAVATHVQYKNKDLEFAPYVTCEAVDHGWVWQIPIQSRIGTGMVFNKNITDPLVAKQYFVEYWNHRIKIEDLNFINWDPFYVKNQWAGNVISIGLSAGFIEPLESTSIAITTYAIGQLSMALNERYYTDYDRNNFNIQMSMLFEDCIDFVSMHYDKNNRTSDFWKYVASMFKPSKRMLHYVEELADPAIDVPTKGKFNYMFYGVNWTLWLQQLGYKIAPRNTSISEELASNLLLQNFTINEKYRNIWSRHQNSEIKRIIDISNI